MWNSNTVNSYNVHPLWRPKGFTGAILFHFLMLILPSEWQTSPPHFPHTDITPQRIEVPGVNSMVQLRSETWISWSTCSRFYYCILHDDKGLERELFENSILIKRTGFGISWDFSLNPGSTIHCCGSWISDLTSCASLSTCSRKVPEKQIDVRWPFSQDAYLRGGICLLLLS